MRSARRSDAGADDSASAKIVVLLNPDLEIVKVSDEYARITLTSHQDIVGVRLFDVFPDNPLDDAANGVENLGASFKRVLETRKPHRMRPQRYDIRDRLAGTSEWIEKIWNPTNTPIFGSGSREIAYLVHEVQDITEAVQLGRWIEEQAKVAAEQRRTLARMQRDLKSRQARLQSAAEHLSSHVRSESGGESIASLRARFGLPNLNRYFSNDGIVPETGIYTAYHEPGCDTATIRVFLTEGRVFPRCIMCRSGVYYRFFLRTSVTDYF